MKSIRLLALVLAFAIGAGLSAVAEHAPNLLKDSSFDEGMIDTPFSSAWNLFGQVHCENVTPKSGAYAAKLYGNFKDEINWSGIYQDVPAEGGKKYIASGYLRQNTGDRLQGENKAWIKLDFYDAQDAQLRAFDTPIKLDGKSAANRHMFMSTGPAMAPDAAVKVRFVVVFEQAADNALGAIVADDVSLTEIR